MSLLYFTVKLSRKPNTYTHAEIDFHFVHHWIYRRSNALSCSRTRRSNRSQTASREITGDTVQLVPIGDSRVVAVSKHHSIFQCLVYIWHGLDGYEHPSFILGPSQSRPILLSKIGSTTGTHNHSNRALSLGETPYVQCWFPIFNRCWIAL